MLNRRTYSGNSAATQNRTGRVHYRPVVAIANTDYRLMDALRERTGTGQIYEHVVSSTAKSHNPRKRRQWTWRLNVTQIGLVMPLVEPWLVLKQEQCRLLLEAMLLKLEFACRPGERWDAPRLSKIRTRLDAIYAAIREANTRGRVAVGGDAL